MGRIRLTEAQLEDELISGRTAAQIARKYGISRQAVSQRIRRRIQRDGEAFGVIDPGRELSRCLYRVNLLQDACDHWLRDCGVLDQYDLGLRAAEIPVTFWEVKPDGTRVRRRANLQWLWDRVAGVEQDAFYLEPALARADPRRMVIQTFREARQIILTTLRLAEILARDEALQNKVKTAQARAASDSNSPPDHERNRR